MITRGIFPKDNKGNLITKQSCQTPGCGHPTWHVCLVGKPDTFDEALQRMAADRARKGKAHGLNVGALSDGRNARWARVREENRARDAKIVARYNENNIGIRQLALEFGIAYQTARRVLVDNGVEIRSKGTTLKNGAE